MLDESPPPPPSYTTAHVAKRLGVSTQTVQRWVDAGHLKAWKTIGGHRRIDAMSADILIRSVSSGEPHGVPADFGVATDDRPFSGLTALVVEDNSVVLSLLGMLVTEALPGVRVESASDGFQGLVAVGRLAPEVVVTDLQMPHLNGVELLRSLASDPLSRPGVLIAVSAMSPEDVAALGGLPDGVRLFHKPLATEPFTVALRDLVDAVRRASPGERRPVT